MPNELEQTSNGRNQKAHWKVGYGRADGEWCLCAKECFKRFVEPRKESVMTGAAAAAYGAFAVMTPAEPARWELVDENSPVPLARAPRAVRVAAAPLFDNIVAALLDKARAFVTDVEKAKAFASSIK